jgi:galactokinase
VQLVERDAVEAFAAHLIGAYRAETGLEAEIIVSEAAAGARVEGAAV